MSKIRFKNSKRIVTKNPGTKKLSFFFCFFSFLFSVISLTLGASLNCLTKNFSYKMQANKIQSLCLKEEMFKVDEVSNGEKINSDAFLKSLQDDEGFINNKSCYSFVTSDNLGKFIYFEEDIGDMEVSFCGKNNLINVFDFDFYAVAGNHVSGIRCDFSFSLANKLLSVFSCSSYEELKNKKMFFNFNGERKNISLYGVVKSNRECFASEIMGEDFVIFHDVELPINEFSYHIIATSGVYRVESILKSFSALGYSLNDNLHIFSNKDGIHEITSSVFESNLFLQNKTIVVFVTLFCLILLTGLFVYVLKSNFDWLSSIIFFLIFLITDLFVNVFATILNNSIINLLLNNYFWLLPILALEFCFLIKYCLKKYEK